MRILVTGAAGYVGSQLLAHLAANPIRGQTLIASDKRPLGQERGAVEYIACDITNAARVDEMLSAARADVVVHLAAIVTPGRTSNRELEYKVDVEGSGHVIDACIRHGVRRLIVSSSGAAYGYHADHPRWLTEDVATRGNEIFAYSWHKHLVERRLAEARLLHPQLEQVVFRVSTVLGPETHNQITDMLERRRYLSITGGDDRFVFIWDQDLVACLRQAITSPNTGVFNVCGDGALGMQEMAVMAGRSFLRINGTVLGALISMAGFLRLTNLRREQVSFLKYRPVLSNNSLKRDFGFVPSMTSREVFQRFVADRLQP